MKSIGLDKTGGTMARKTVRVSNKVRAQLKQFGIMNRSAPLGELPYHVLLADNRELTEGNIRLAKELVALKAGIGLEKYREQAAQLELLQRQMEAGHWLERVDVHLAANKSLRNTLRIIQRHYKGHETVSQACQRKLAIVLLRWAFTPLKNILVSKAIR